MTATFDDFEVDRRRLAGDRDGLLQRRHFQLAVDRHRRAGAEVDAFDVQRGEAGQLELDRVDAAREQREAVDALLVGDRGAGAADQVRAGDRYGDAGQRAATAVGRSSRDVAGRALCPGHDGNAKAIAKTANANTFRLIELITPSPSSDMVLYKRVFGCGTEVARV